MLDDAMFADSLLETSWVQRARRSLTTLTSFGLQAVVIGLLLLVPLMRTVGLPSARTVSTPISAGRSEPAPMPRGRKEGTAAASPSNAGNARFVAPGRVPDTISMAGVEAVPQPSYGGGDGVEGLGIPGTGAGLPISLFSGNHPVMPKPAPPTTPQFRTSRMLEGNLIHRVEPAYPALARSTRVQGSVVLYAIISKAGTIDNLRVLSGHPMLVAAAIDAVRQWRYRPYILNNEPIEVETQITVNFVLSGN